jgi:hypothetical protein
LSLIPVPKFTFALITYLITIYSLTEYICLNYLPILSMIFYLIQHTSISIFLKSECKSTSGFLTLQTFFNIFLKNIELFFFEIVISLQFNSLCENKIITFFKEFCFFDFLKFKPSM